MLSTSCETLQVLSGAGELIAEGMIRQGDVPGEEPEQPNEASSAKKDSATQISAREFYTDLSRNRLQYGPTFRMVEHIAVTGTLATLRWGSILSTQEQLLMVPG